MYKFKKATTKFIKQCGFVLTYPATLLYKGFYFINTLGIGGFFSAALFIWIVSRLVCEYIDGKFSIMNVVIYFILFGIVGTLGAKFVESVLYLLLSALQPIYDTNKRLQESIKKSSVRTLEDYIYEMRHKKAYEVKKVGL